MKAYQSILFPLILAAVALVSVAGCESPFEEDLFDNNLAHVRFEYWGVPLTEQDPRDNPLDTAVLADGEAIPAVVSIAGYSETLTVGFSVVSSAELTRGTHFDLVDRSGIPINEYVFEPEVYYDSIFFEAIDLTGVSGFIQLELTSTSRNSLSLGMPGALEERKRFTIEVEEAE